MRKRNFDPVKYWGSKPICLICKKRKVVTGNICHECQEEGHWKTKFITEDAQAIAMNPELVSPEIETDESKRFEASPLIISLVGYLYDCAQEILKTLPLVDITSTSDVIYLPLKEDALDRLTEDDLNLDPEEAMDLYFKISSQSEELELIYGIVFIKGYKKRTGENKDMKVNAPLLYLKLDVSRNEDGKIHFGLKDETVFLNQAIISKLVDDVDEDELESRIQELFESIPSWPLDLESINAFVGDVTNIFPSVVTKSPELINSLEAWGSVEVKETERLVEYSNCLIVTPKQNAEGTVVNELFELLNKIKSGTALDSIFDPTIGSSSENSGFESTGEGGQDVNEDEGCWKDIFPLELSDTQKQIVVASRTNRLTVVSGPPGTGKSYTIAAIILDHLLAGKRVLFASRMDKAVEVVVNTLEVLISRYCVARSGARKAQRELSDKLDELTGSSSKIRKISESELSSLEKQYLKITDQLDEIKGQFENVLTYEKEWSNVHEKIKNINKAIAKLDLTIESHIDEKKATKLKSKVTGADFLIKNKTFFLQTWWGNTTLKRVKKQLGLPETTTVKTLLAVIEKLKNEDKRLKIEQEIESFQEINDIWGKILQIKEQKKILSSRIINDTIMSQLYWVINDHQKRKDIRNFLMSLKLANPKQKSAMLKSVNLKTLISAFPCWASTTFQLSQVLPLEPGIFDLVIFDEASQCDLASSIPALYRANRAVIVGDPKQLNHVVFISKQAEYAAFVKNKLPQDAQIKYRFTTKSLFDVAENNVEQENYYMLDEHFRSRPHIIAFSSEKFYGGKLRIMTERPVVGEESIAITVDYVNGFRNSKTGAINKKEVEKVFKYVKEIIEKSQDDHPTTIGILCPFRDQVNAIVKELPKYLNTDDVDKHKIVVGTAHSLQGDEKDVVILTLSIDKNYHHGTLNFLQKPNVFNVSITRAKKQLIVLSSVEPKDLPNGLLKDFLLYARATLQQTLSTDKFDSYFEQDVAETLIKLGFSVWPQYESAGFFIDLVVGDGKNYIAVECDGPTHFELEEKQNYKDIWRQEILQRAGWRFIRIPYRSWELDRDGCIRKIEDLLSILSG